MVKISRYVVVRPYRFLYTLAVAILAGVWIGWPGVVIAVLQSIDNHQSS